MVHSRYLLWYETTVLGVLAYHMNQQYYVYYHFCIDYWSNALLKNRVLYYIHIVLPQGIFLDFTDVPAVRRPLLRRVDSASDLLILLFCTTK